MMKLTEGFAIAVNCMSIIANSPKGMNTASLSEITKYSRNHLASILNILVRRNYLRSVRGPRGGFHIKKQPQDILLIEIYNLICGEIKEFQCAMTCKQCCFTSCLFGHIPQEFTRKFKKHLQETTLADFDMKTFDWQ